MKLKFFLSILTLCIFIILAGGSIDDDGNIAVWFWLTLIVTFVVIPIVVVFIQSNKTKQKKKAVENNYLLLDNFTITKKISDFHGFYYFCIDEEHKKIAYITDKPTIFIKFDEILMVELLENSQITASRSLGRTIGGAAVGGIVGGGAGSIIGGLSGNQKMNNAAISVIVRITTKDINNSHIEINCFNASEMAQEDAVKQNTISYGLYYMPAINKAREIMDIIRIIIDKEEKSVISNASNNSCTNQFIADELLKLAELKDKGIISEAEFNSRKDILLNN